MNTYIMEVREHARMLCEPYRQLSRLKMHLRSAAASEIVIGSSRAWGTTVTKCHWVSPRACKLQRTMRVTHPRNHCTKISLVRSVRGTVGEGLLQRIV